jgi:hypothetical protein
MSTSGRKTKLTISRVTVNDGTITVDRGDTFTVMLNPSELKLDRAIEYNSKQALGSVGSDTKFSAVLPDHLSFALLLDGTGAVPRAAGEQRQEVADQLNALYALIYKYDGMDHQPDRVRILWGSLLFYGRLETIGVQYTLFKPSGDPLRAKVDLKFKGFMNPKDADLAASRSSPDLSHLVEVRDGDTLPLLCDRIYGDPAYYPDVARHNGLPRFRRLTPGQRLHFPPLV